jgi:hypothetical protein
MKTLLYLLGLLTLLGLLGGCMGTFRVTTTSNGEQRKELCIGWRTDGNDAKSMTEVELDIVPTLGGVKEPSGGGD